MVQQIRVFGLWRVLGSCIYGMILVEIGSLFASQMEGQNFQKIIKKKLGERYDWKWA